MSVAVSILCFVLAIFAGVQWVERDRKSRETFIRDFLLPNGLFEALRAHHPQLTLKDCQLVSQGLRQFFLVHLKSGYQFISMPSQVADDLWHEFILYTRDYEQFCKQAFGGMLHHTPAIALGEPHQGNAGIRRAWRFACEEENINPRKPSRLPLLFALDGKLNIPNGFIYVPNCSKIKRTAQAAGNAGAAGAYCGADLATGSDGGGSGSGDGGDGGIDGGGGDGGGGCGGGGCGGGGD
jgi:hypothetical protein